jgi:tRNA threonylcarbamoyl adenosine modification protein YeaZ
MHKGQAENLLPILGDVLEQAGVAYGDLTAIGVGTGPGNFTGIRISVATARGMALTLGIPAVGVTALEAQVVGFSRPTYSAIAARRETYYLQQVSEAAVHGTVSQVGLEELMAATQGQTVVCTEEGQAFTAPRAPIAVSIAKIAAARFANNAPMDRPTPFYVRSADAAPAKDAPPVILD